jgi:hypothetical protein
LKALVFVGGIFERKLHVHRSGSSFRLSRGRPSGTPFSHFAQKLVGLNVEWVLLKNAADDDYRMGSDGVDDDFPAEASEIIGADHGVGVQGPYVIDPSLEFQQQIETRSFFQGPFRMRDIATDGKALFPSILEHTFEQRQLSIRIERPVMEKSIAPIKQVKLTTVLTMVDIDPGRAHSPQMIAAPQRIDYVDCFVAACKTVLNERKRYVVLSIAAVEERANMTRFTEL